MTNHYKIKRCSRYKRYHNSCSEFKHKRISRKHEIEIMHEYENASSILDFNITKISYFCNASLSVVAVYQQDELHTVQISTYRSTHLLCGSNSTSAFIKLNWRNDIMITFLGIGLRSVLQRSFDDQSTLVQAWCHQTTDHYLNQCWLSVSSHGVAALQWDIHPPIRTQCTVKCQQDSFLNKSTAQ